jgi:hypothetical protein
MTDLSTAYHEASHAVAAFERGLPVIYLSIRPAEGEAGRTRFDGDSEAFGKLDPLSCAIIKIAGEVGARMAAGANTSTEARFNWFADDGDGSDAEDARHFIAQAGEDELGNRQLATFRAYALLRVRWEAVEEIAAKLQRQTTVLGQEVSKICLADAARRGARARAANPPKPLPPPRRPKRPRVVQSGNREVRPFTFHVAKGAK